MDDIIPPERPDYNKNTFSLDKAEPRPQMSRLRLPPQEDEVSGPKPDLGEQPQPPKLPRNKRFTMPRFKHTKLNKKQWILLAAALVMLIGIGSVSAFYLYKHFSKPPTLTNVARVPRKPRTEPSRLTGVKVDAELNLRPITGVMIENSPDARPQSGLRQAGVVYEAIAEGGITRFLALYQEAQPNYIGPVRSVRPYYLEFALPFQASVAHVGGSPEGLAQVRTLHIRDLDQFANPGAYWRITQRYAPHNVYTSSAKLDALEKSKGYTKSSFTSFLRKKDTPVKTPSAKTIDFSISGYYYGVHYVYEPKSNSYLRSEGGAAHIDERSGKQLKPKVVIALVMSYSLASDGKHSRYVTTGSGVMYVFQDGIVTQGTWRKASSGSQISFLNTAGKPIRLNAGQTWISLVGERSDVTYKP